MAIDVLQDVLNTLRFQGLIAGIHTFAAPWGYITAPESPDIAFVVLVEGSGLLQVEGGNPSVCSLQSGDLVVMPQRTRFILRDTMYSPILPFTELKKIQGQGAVGKTTRIASGCYRVVDNNKLPILSVLPPLIHLHQEDYQSTPEMDLLMRLFLAEAAHEDASQPSVLNRLAEVCFIHLLRRFAARTLEGAGGWLRGLADPPVAAALQAIHAHPAETWTVERLAAEAHLSRSAFAERFRALVGETPLQYLQRWRMQRAAYLLDTENLPLKTIIALSGYTSEKTFRKVFQRWMGVLPSQYKLHLQRSAEETQTKEEAPVP